MRDPAVLLWIVDSEQWPRACLRAELLERGYDAVGFVAIEDAIGALSRGDAPPRLMIVELKNQGDRRGRIQSAAQIWDSAAHLDRRP